MDLNTIQPKNIFVNLEHPGTGAELGLVFEMRSRHSDEVSAVSDRWEAQWSKKRGKEPSPSAKRAHSRDLILASVVGWEWEDPELTFDGEQPQFSPDTLKAWLKDKKRVWLLEFLAKQLIEDEHFFTS